MTEPVEVAETASTIDDVAPQAPSGHYYAKMKQRWVLVRDINPAQAMLLGGMVRSSKNAGFEANFDTLGKLMKLFQVLIADAGDREWLEEGILTGEVDVADFAQIWLGNPEAVEVKPVAPKKPRRGRGQ